MTKSNKYSLKGYSFKKAVLNNAEGVKAVLSYVSSKDGIKMIVTGAVAVAAYAGVSDVSGLEAPIAAGVGIVAKHALDLVDYWQSA